MVCILSLYIAGFSATRKAVPSQTERKPDAHSDWLKNTVPQPDPLQTQPNVFWKGACQWQVNSALPRNARTYMRHLFAPTVDSAPRPPIHVPFAGRRNPISERLAVLANKLSDSEKAVSHQVTILLCDGTSDAELL